MSSTTSRRVSAALALTALLALPASPAVAGTAATARDQGPAASALGFFEQTWRSLAILLGTPAGAAAAPAPARHRLTARHADLGGFIDPDGARFLSQTPHTTVVTP